MGLWVGWLVGCAKELRGRGEVALWRLGHRKAVQTV